LNYTYSALGLGLCCLPFFAAAAGFDAGAGLGLAFLFFPRVGDGVITAFATAEALRLDLVIPKIELIAK